ncbi:DUF1684 domain-containing protein [Pedobacter foliorum]|uniref:DUF1684 domain-containing protein n=1 Tax=Pedobacter foliorum TaxID=2739058 RepID=UPI001C2554A8|nr:DUF1684 domain-containing protein [Pedobacter foliorum]
MIRYFFILFMMIQLNSFGQSYKTQIEKHREHYKEDFLKDFRSPLKQDDLKNLHFFEADSNYRVNAKVELLKNEIPFQMPTYTGTSREYIRYAILSFKLNGVDQKLTVYKSISLSKVEEYKNHLFLPFTDESNSEETYGGGRYIDLSSQDISGDVIEVDFNKAYNPYCAYSDGYQCPKPPVENDIKLKVKAGEMIYTGDKKHK